MATKIEGYINLTVSLTEEEDGQWSALCHELGTAACGDTFEEALDGIRDMVTLDLNSMEELGMRKAFFKKHNITIHRTQPSRPPKRRTVKVRMDEFVTSILQPVPAMV